MKLHIVTIGRPKLPFAQSGWEEYIKRLGRFHQVKVSHLADRFANDSAAMLQAASKAYLVALVIEGEQTSSEALAKFLEERANDGKELCFVIGGPEGLPAAVIERADYKLSFSKLTFPHDLAMVILAEALYRASTINAQHPYHRG